MFYQIARNVLASNVSTLSRKTLRKIRSPVLLTQTTNTIHTSNSRRKNNTKDDSPPSALVLHAFEKVEYKEKKAYLDIIREYKNNNEMRHGHVEFIKVALNYMDDFGVSHDLAVYKALLDVLPKSKFIPRNYLQSIFMHYPKQQYVAVELLCKMEHKCVIPDVEVQTMLLNIFGIQGLPLKKFWRMMYWMPKFSNLNPWPCPRPAPKDPRILAKIAISKISSVDVQTKITQFESKKDTKDSIEDTWIISAMSLLQKELLQSQPINKPIFVEGPYAIWVADQYIDYFVLRGDSEKKEKVYKNIDDVSNIRIPFWNKQDIEIVRETTVHEQNDGTYFAMCATGTSTKDSLLSWIRCLQKENPILNEIPIVFKIASSIKENILIDNETKTKIAQKTDDKNI